MPWEKNLRTEMLSRNFCRTASMIQRIFRIWKVVELFFRKSFWFFLRIFSISGRIRLWSRALQILPAKAVSYAYIILTYPEVTFLGEEEDAASFVVCWYTALHNRRRMSSNFLAAKFPGVFRRDLQLFYFWFFYYCCDTMDLCCVCILG